MKRRFPLGQILATPGVLQALELNRQDMRQFLSLHALGEWGDICHEDRAENERALATGERLLSVYYLDNGEKIWIITERDRSATTVLLPGEY